MTKFIRIKPAHNGYIVPEHRKDMVRCARLAIKQDLEFEDNCELEAVDEKDATWADVPDWIMELCGGKDEDDK